MRLVWHYQKNGVQGVPARTFSSLEEVKEQMPHLFRTEGPYTFGEADGGCAAVLHHGCDTGWRLIPKGS